MGLHHDIVGAEVYITRANRRIAKQRALIRRSHNPRLVSTAQDLVDVLIALRTNVEHQRQQLRREAATTAAGQSH